MSTEEHDDVTLEVDHEEEEALPPPRHNPCEALTNLARPDGAIMKLGSGVLHGASHVKSYVFGEQLEARSYEGVQVVGVAVRRRENERSRGHVRKQWTYTLKTKTRLPGCDLDLVIGGGGIYRSMPDFLWLREALKAEHAGCIAPPITAEAWAGDAAVLERFLAQCVSHEELCCAPELAAFCTADESAFAAARAGFDAAYAQRPPLVVRVGALVLDVVGDATPISLDGDDDDDDEHAVAAAKAAKRREHDVRELHAWARDQLHSLHKCEKECAAGAAALEAFEASCTSARTSLAAGFRADAEQAGADAVRESGPARALAALRQMSGLAKALCEAVDGRETLRLQLVSSRNALHLNEASRDARGAMLETALSQRRAADAIWERLAAEDAASGAGQLAASLPALGHSTSHAELDAPIISFGGALNFAPPEDGGEPGSLRARLAGAKYAAASWGRWGLDASLGAAGRVRQSVSSRDEAGQSAAELMEVARRATTRLQSLGLRVVSRVADGAAYVSSDDEDVEKARLLVGRLEQLFSTADDRLRRDAPLMKVTWEVLQIDAFDAFARGEASRAVVAQKAAQATELHLQQLRLHNGARDKPAAT